MDIAGSQTLIAARLGESVSPIALRTMLAGMAVWAIGVAYSFRQTLLSSFDVMTGDRGDARLIVYLH